MPKWHRQQREKKTKTTTVILVHRHPVHIIIIIIIIIIRIIIREIRKASTLRLKTPNKHSVTHIMYIKMENAMSNLTKILKHNVDIKKGSSITM